MRKNRSSPVRALVSGLIGIIIFLLVLVLFRFIADQTSWELFSGFVDLLYASAPLIIFFSVMFMIGDIFAAFEFPFNLPFPIFSAVGSVLLVSFIIRIITFIDAFYSLGISTALELVKLILYPLTIIVVLAGGYLSIIAQFRKRQPVESVPSPGPGRAGSSPRQPDMGGDWR